MKQAVKPCFLDEVDKMSSDFRGSGSALREVLDSEQNHASATTILRCLLIIKGYVYHNCQCGTQHPRLLLDRRRSTSQAIQREEKAKIAERQLIPSRSRSTGLNHHLQISENALRSLSDIYLEAGVRNLSGR